jgi:hypothetical protein
MSRSLAVRKSIARSQEGDVARMAKLFMLTGANIGGSIAVSTRAR